MSMKLIFTAPFLWDSFEEDGLNFQFCSLENGLNALGYPPPPHFIRLVTLEPPHIIKKRILRGFSRWMKNLFFFLLYWKMLLLQWAVSQIFRGLEELQPQNGRQKQASNTSTPSLTTSPDSHPKLGKEGSDNIKFRILFYNPN